MLNIFSLNEFVYLTRYVNVNLHITMAAEAPCETVITLRKHISIDTAQHLSSIIINHSIINHHYI